MVTSYPRFGKSYPKKCDNELLIEFKEPAEREFPEGEPFLNKNLKNFPTRFTVIPL